MAINKIIQEKQFIYQKTMNNEMNTITLEEFSHIFKYLIENNKRLTADKKYPITVGIEGEAGTGKTSIIEQLAEEMGMTFVKINLSELEEVSDLTGFPIKEYLMSIKDEDGNFKEKWIPAEMLSVYTQLPCGDYEFLDQSRMSYATPAWLPREANPNGTILLIDDYTRANSLFMQATMELINTGRYISWSLPENTNIVLSSNPDNGSYSVTSLDSAQKSRFINFTVKFDIEPWAKWAEESNLDNRAINFCLSYFSEIFTEANGLKGINPRSYVTFCNAISGIENWDKPENLAMILNISKGCFHDEENVIGSLFTVFIKNKLDKLIAPKDMLLGDWSTIKTKIKQCVYDEYNSYHPEIASVLATRLLNYAMLYFNTKGSETKKVQERLIEIIDNDTMLFSEDLIFNIVKTLAVKNSAKMNKLMIHPKIRSKMF
jgi:hypothetical protein